MFQGGSLDLPFNAVLSFAMIQFELLIIAIFQKYSSKVDELLNYPSLLQGDFVNEHFLKSGRILVFFYAKWCPFCRSAFHQLSSLSSISYKIFRVDLSDE
jgi:thiol-disulfide isomerase/thioredoxin